MSELDTIIAPATPLGRSALAIVRLDGPAAIEIVGRLADRSEPFEDRRAALVHLRDAEGLLDEAVVTACRGPHTFTGNDLVEVSLHGSPFLVERFIRTALRHGARIAEPGEFTERAVLNGKLDLVQAESIADLVASRTALQARLSLANLEGELSRAAGRIRSELLFLISRLEAALDFADEGYEFIERPEAARRVEKALAEVKMLEATYQRGNATARGLTAVILGRPNAGKSTLLNHLCGSDRAIVTPIPGTTRDLLRETLEVGGLPVTLVDTAGLREEAGEVEGIGIERARSAARIADLVIYLIDSAAGVTEEDEREITALPDPMVVFTKIDLPPPADGGTRAQRVTISAAISIHSGRGVGEFLGMLDRLVRERFAAAEESPTIVNERQRAAVAECGDALVSALESLADAAEEQIVLVDLFRASNALGILTGAISREEVLHEIFAKFCIGK